MTIPSDAWLERINDRMQREEIPIKSRPMKAIDYFQTEFNIKSTALNSPEAKKIISWFKENTNPRSLSIGSLYKGVFLYDTVFWEVRVPHFFGTVNLEIYKYIIDMPDVTKNKIINDDTHHDNYYILYTSLIEYANNKTIVEHPGCKYYQDDFLSNANIKINSIVCHLLEDIPNQYAGIGCSEAVELFFKAILHHKFGYEKDTLKKSFGHNLCKLFNKVINLTQDNQMRSLGYMFDKFPTMNSRYDATPYTNQELWNLYFVTQMIATTSLKILS